MVNIVIMYFQFFLIGLSTNNLEEGPCIKFSRYHKVEIFNDIYIEIKLKKSKMLI